MFSYSWNSAASALMTPSPQQQDAIAMYVTMANPISSQHQRYIGLAHAAIEHALYFLEIDDCQRAAAYFEYASQQFRSMSNLEQPPAA